MRQFVWGLIFGAGCMYGYTFYGHYFVDFRDYTMEWRNGAVKETGGYAVSRDADGSKRRR